MENGIMKTSFIPTAENAKEYFSRNTFQGILFKAYF
jgi:hypothetical protein